MNTSFWIRHFRRNAALAVDLPDALPCALPETVRNPLARSLAVFQLGESGDGTRLRRYVRTQAPAEHLQGYGTAVDLFVAEEQGHAALLARVVRHLGGELLDHQWTNSAFRWVRDLVNLEFTIQVLLTAELIAEVYYGTLALRAPDAVVQAASRKIVRDEVKHLAFQRAFLAERLAVLAPAWRALWFLQFRLIHALTARIVAWDHRDCLRALGVDRRAWQWRCARARADFERKLRRHLDEVTRHGFVLPEPAR
jgi:hypothetical protein